MRFQTLSMRLTALLILMSVLISACSSNALATPTEMEIVIGPPEETLQAKTPVPTPTLRATVTPTVTPTVGPTIAPSPTNTLDPYNELIFQGLEFRKEEDFNQALVKLSEAIRMEPENPLAYYERGRVYLDQGMYDEAITDFNFGVNYNADYAEAYNARGVAWAMKDQNTQALNDFNQAIELDPNLASAYSNRAQAYLSMEQYENALADFSKVVELHPDDHEAYFNRAQAYLSVMQFAKEGSYLDLCIADFNQVIAMLPDMADSYSGRGQCYWLKKDLQNAYADYSMAITLDPESYQVRLLRATLYPDIGTIDEALADAQYVLDNAQDSELVQQARLMLDEIPKLPTPTLGPSPTPQMP